MLCSFLHIYTLVQSYEQPWAAIVVSQPQETFLTSVDSYNEQGLLLSTEPCGVHECGASCSSARCKRNMQVQQASMSCRAST